MKFVTFALVTSVFGSGGKLRGAKPDNSWVKGKDYNTPSIHKHSEVQGGQTADRSSWITDRYPLAAGQVRQTAIPAKPEDVPSTNEAANIGGVSKLALINPNSIPSIDSYAVYPVGADVSKLAYGGYTPSSKSPDVSKLVHGGSTPPSNSLDISKLVYGGYTPSSKSPDVSKLVHGGDTPTDSSIWSGDIY